jgi:hypothetical protein
LQACSAEVLMRMSDGFQTGLLLKGWRTQFFVGLAPCKDPEKSKHGVNFDNRSQCRPCLGSAHANNGNHTWWLARRQRKKWSGPADLSNLSLAWAGPIVGRKFRKYYATAIVDLRGYG